MRKLFVTLFIAVVSLTSLAGQSTKTAPEKAQIASQTIIAEPQTKCEGGLVSVQFKGEPAEWYQTKKTCGAVSADQKVCCCKGKEYDTATHRCLHSGKLLNKNTGHIE